MALYEEKAAEAAPYGAPRTIVASSASISLNNKSEVESIRQRNTASAGWQTAAWECYNLVGEVNYAFNYAASVLSRVRFHPAVALTLDSAPVDVTDAVTVKTGDDGSTEGTVNGIDPRLAKLAVKYMQRFAGRSGTAPMAKAFALNVQVAGECYLCCIENDWAVKSTSEVRIDATNRPLLQPSRSVSTLSPRRLRKGTPIGRIWNQHPQYSSDADSSLHAVLSDCEELILLSRLMRVTARSRLNAGLLFVPEEMSAAARTIGDETGVDVDEDDPQGSLDDDEQFEKELFDTMTAPVAAEDNAAAIVPMLVRGPADQGDKIKYIQFARSVGEDLATRSKEVLTRVLQGINAPKELATGMSGSRYNNAQLIDEQSYKALVEPLALMFADAVTDIVLRPQLRAAIKDVTNNPWVTGIDDIEEQVDRIVCWYDPSEVVTSVDQSQSANEGWDRQVLSDDAWRKAHGFSDSAKPSEKELAARLALKQVAVPPAIQEALLRVALPEIFAQAQKASSDANGVGLPPELQSMLQDRGDGSVAPSPPVPATSVPLGA